MSGNAATSPVLPPDRGNQSPFERVAYLYMDRGYSVIPIAPGTKRPGDWSEAEGWRGMSRWQRFGERQPTDLEIDIWSKWPGAGIGVVLGKQSGIIGLDRDYDAPGTDALDRLIPFTPVKKKGAKGYVAFFRYNGERSRSFNIGGVRVLDVLSDGRQTLMPGTIHPDGHTYVYLTEDTLEGMDPSELPLLPLDFDKQVERCIAPFQNDEDRKFVSRAAPDNTERVSTTRSIAAEYYADMNAMALANLPAWVEKLVPGAIPNGESWRCIATWRECELPRVGIHPQGIFDFGGNYGMTPIDLVMHANGLSFGRAAGALRECLPEMAGEPLTMTVGEVAIGQTLAANDAATAVPSTIADARDPWMDVVDPFVTHVAPPFPVHCLPPALADYCREQSASSGFDVGAYGFAMLVAASTVIDHRSRIAVNAKFSTPPFLWGVLVAAAGDGKSPVIKAATRFIEERNADLSERSDRNLREWQARIAGMSKKDAAAEPRPRQRQLSTMDTTVEALVQLLLDNPTGILMKCDELAGFIGRMDAYNAGAGADRSAYLEAFDASPRQVNRVSRGSLYIRNFSVAVLAGVQPGRLTEMQKKSGSDGLFQRFLVYAPAPSGPVNYSVGSDDSVDRSCREVFERIMDWTEKDEIKRVHVSSQVQQALQHRHNLTRELTRAESCPRLGEHVDKYPGFMARVLFTLHVLECAASSDGLRDEVGMDTYRRADEIMRVLLRHSEAVYRSLEGPAADSLTLMRSACEAILSKGWRQLVYSNLSQHATGWRGDDRRLTDSAVNLLIELGWVRDINVTSKSGRRAYGKFEVNPAVHEKFAPEAERIRKAREERHIAIQQLAAARSDSARPWQRT